MSEKSLEHFQQKVDNIKLDLDKIKKETGVSDLEKKKQDIDKKIYAANEAIDDELSDLKKNADKNKESISKLEELKKTLESFSPELSNLKKEVLDSSKTEAKEEGKPSLFAKLVYGGLIGKLASKIPLFGDGIKEWADDKVKESAEESIKEKKNDKKEHSGFWSNAWKRLGGAALAGGAVALGSKASSSEGGFWNKLKSRFSSDKKEEDKPTEITPVVDSTPQTTTSDQVPTDTENTQANIPPASTETTPNEKDPEKEVQKMRSQGMSELYILTRMFELGYVPKNPYPRGAKTLLGGALRKITWVLDGGPLHNLGTMKDWLAATIKYSKDDIMKQKLTAISKNPPFAKLLDQQFAELTEMEKFLNTPNPDIKQFNKRFAGPDAKVKLDHIGKDPATIKQSIETKKASMAEIDKHVKDLDKQILDIQKNAQNKLAEYDKLAKANVKDPQKLAQIRKESQAYIKEYNTKVSQAQKLLLEDVSKVPNKAELLRLSSDNISLSTLLKTNGGVDGFLTKISSSKLSRGVGKAALALAVLKIVGGGFGEFQKQGFLSKETGMEAADLGLGLIPVVGGLYDIGIAIHGKDLNGRDLATWERWTRAGIGLTSSVVDVFTVGTGGTAMRAASKIGIKIATKEAEKTGVELAVKTAVKITEKTAVKTTIKGLEVGMQLASYGFLGYSVYQEAAPIMITVGEAIDHKTESNVDLHI